MKVLQLYLAILASLLLTSCLKDPIFKPIEPKLPEATQEGLNTFGCYKNGELWLPGPVGGEGFLTPYLYTAYWTGNKQLIISTGNAESNLDFYLHGDLFSQKYYLNDTLSYVEYSMLQPEANNLCIQTNVRSNSSFVTITRFDTTARVVSGLFQVYFSDSCGSAHVFTDGRFDCKLAIINSTKL